MSRPAHSRSSLAGREHRAPERGWICSGVRPDGGGLGLPVGAGRGSDLYCMICCRRTECLKSPSVFIRSGASDCGRPGRIWTVSCAVADVGQTDLRTVTRLRNVVYGTEGSRPHSIENYASALNGEDAGDPHRVSHRLFNRDQPVAGWAGYTVYLQYSM